MTKFTAEGADTGADSNRALNEHVADLESTLRIIQTVLDSLPMGVAVNSVNPEVKFVYMNDRFPEIYGVTRESLCDPGAFWDAVYEDPGFREEMRRRIEGDCASGDPSRMRWVDVPITRKGKPIRYVIAQNIPLPEQQLMISTVMDVTERKRLEYERDLSTSVLGALRSSADLHSAIASLTGVLQQWTGCEAVGVRLRQGHDYPYFETRGFSKEFVEQENSLCVRDADGQLMTDRQGAPILECMCGNILSGRFDPSLPFFTPFGSFWTNSTTKLLAATTEKERQARTRNRCNTAGYESVALIPLKVHGRIIGLMQFNDKRRDWFTLQQITLWERLSERVVLALDQQMAQQALKQSEAIQRTLIRSIPDIIWFKDVEGCFQNCNHMLELYHGRREEEIIGKTDHDLMPKERADVYRAFDLKVMSENRICINEEWLHFAANGYSGLFETIETPVRDEAEAIIGVLGVSRDITRHRQTEDELRKRESLVERMFNLIPVGLWVANREGVLVRGNKAGKEIWGAELPDYSRPETFKARHLPDGRMLTADDWALTRCIKNQETTVDELLEIENAGGRRKIILNYVAPLLQNDHTLLGAVVVNQDMTAHWEAREALRESNNRFRSYIDNAPYGIFILNETMRHLQVNNEACRSTGYTADELLAMSNQELLDPGYRELGRNMFRELRENGAGEGELLFVTKNGEQRWGSVKGVKLSETHFLVFTADITARKQAETEQKRLQEQLLQSQKMESIGRLAGGVAHDFNNMLQTILGYTEFLLDDCGSESPMRDGLQEISKAAVRSSDLIRQLLAFARKQTVTPKVINLNGVVSGMLKMLKRLLGEDIELEWLPAPGEVRVNVDPSQMDQILVNLAVNARDAIQGIGRLTIATEVVSLGEPDCKEPEVGGAGTYAKISVRDNGCGIGPDAMEHLFEPFFTTKGVGRGTGLGLSTVYGIVKQNEGFIRVESEVGKGTVFRIYLPQAASGSESERTEQSAKPLLKGGQETVLLVEDESAIAGTVCRFLATLGYQVLVADSPEKALQLSREFSGEIPLVITDVIMPGMSGRDMAAKLIEQRPALKTLYMSGYTADIIAHRGVLDADVHFLSKPFSRDDLAKKIRSILDT